MSRTVGILCLLAAVGVAGPKQKKINAKRPPEIVRNLVAEIGSKLWVDPDLENEVVRVELRDVTPKEAAEQIAKQLGAKVHVSREGTIRIIEAWKAPIAERLDFMPMKPRPYTPVQTRKVHLEWVRDWTSINVVLDPHSGPVPPFAIIDPSGEIRGAPTLGRSSTALKSGPSGKAGSSPREDAGTSATRLKRRSADRRGRADITEPPD